MSHLNDGSNGDGESLKFPVEIPKPTEWSRFDAGGHPDYILDNNSLDMHLAWTIWHEGAPIYREKMRINEVRINCAGKQAKNVAAANLIMNSTNNELQAALNRMSTYFDILGNGGFQMLRKHMDWVLKHKKKRIPILTLLDDNKFGEIRAQYQSSQEDNPHVHYIVQAVKDETLREMLNGMRDA